MNHIAVLDIGKTNVKLALVDLAARSEQAVITRPNLVLAGPPYPHFDTEAIWEFLIDGLRGFHAHHGVDGISVTTHGACAALLMANGDLAAPVMDYEFGGPDSMRKAYDKIRPPFGETGSPALPMGLNLGAQLFWQLQNDSTLADRTAFVVTWPQYWGFRLTGEFAADVTSLGCHTDLWNPHQRGFSSLPDRLGLGGKIAVPRKPGAILGQVSAAVSVATGLPDSLPVLCGIHDSNASLLPHLIDRPAPFAVVSTGTWVIAMAVGNAVVRLDPARDTLINVNAHGDPVPSARFMGGREYELMRTTSQGMATTTDADRVLARDVMLLPAVVPESGPFQGHHARWAVPPGDAAEMEVALGYYLALMTAECFSQIEASGPSIIEGPFAANPWFISMLAAVSGRAVIASTSRTGTAIGAALLFEPPTTGPVQRVAPEPSSLPDPRLLRHARLWQALTARPLLH